MFHPRALKTISIQEKYMSFEKLQKKYSETLVKHHMTQQPTFGKMYEQDMNSVTTELLPPPIHWSILYNNQEIK